MSMSEQLGLLGRKVGMMRIFTDDGDTIPVTVLDVSNNRVTQVKTTATDGYNALQVAFGSRKASRVSKPEAGHLAKAGVEAGDIITRVDGKVVEKSGDLPRLVGGTRPGSKATLQIFRRGSNKELSVTVGEFEPDRPTRRAQAEPGGGSAPVKSALGVTASDLTDAQKRELKLKGGVRVDAVDGAAARAGLREGDLILSVDNTEITDLRQFAAVAAKVEKSRAVSVLVRRGEWVNYLVIRPNR